jgi:crotonobetainyl-CoA:carnitine CoA-transferase CaiB-like acyl-CoA transferase
VDLLNAKGVPSGPILNVQEAYENEQVRHLGMAVPVEHPALGEIRVQAPPVTLSRTPASVRLHAPDASEHTGEILGELGFSRDDIALHEPASTGLKEVGLTACERPCPGRRRRIPSARGE